MSPSQYRHARSEASKCPSYSCTADKKPYFPFLAVDPSDDSSIKSAVVKILLHVNNRSEDSIQSNEIGENSGTVCSIEKVSGGITNDLYKVVIKSKKVLIRIFGAVGLIDRDEENSCYAALAEKGIAPPYYGRFANGRIEGWLEMRPLETEELGLFTTQISKQLARLHTDFLAKKDEEPTMWTQLRSWMDQALLANFQTNFDIDRAAKLNLELLPADIEWLQHTAVPRDSKTAFCHNDVLAANVLVSSDKRDIQLIDFEYGGQNYVAFDIANHFNEYAGGTSTGIPNYGLYPSAEMQREFVEEYLRTALCKEPTFEEVNRLLGEVQPFVLVNHLYWGLWAVNQAAAEGTDNFDYLLYSKHRINRYRELKAIFKIV
mmetsp:Transcript_2180/g.3144  ORF Transcript_2180/g.3144 Transcript_2180/m.3144 type:complete len:375 (+) Transcript_2180:154-1278(+)|eukprot:CAMPEP_0178896854 /NCGR_PEP_ID=MMETSP0786-20121207/1414_1 /TAXON_ID=186022 /ORGANISM="Thalassionema frauenfeldii, Strain CCMP 1798" /LENGTH=374 /DNA_ID=CAMNT_0020567323 /DNA_START=57 /DNA_END=1181 /DNA_ORIENTATION=+